ncbi:MAG: phage portal protein [Planctomycetes bacterium]|nr:phage portal protein [Planctomycetota bacterium]
MSDSFTRALSLALEHTSPLTRSERPSVSRPDELYALYTSEGDNARRAEARFIWDMYRGDQLRYIPRLPGESATEFLRRPHKQFLNVTRVIIDVLSQLYRRPVERQLDADKRVRERIQRVWDRNTPDRLLLGLDRLARLQGVAAVRVSFEQGEVRYWPWPAHRLVCIPDLDRPDTPAAVIAFAAGDGSLAHVWSPERVSTVAGGRIISEQEHGLGRVPFAFVHDQLIVDGFWTEGRGRAVAFANAEFNAKLSELAHTVAMQGFGVMEIVNPDPAQEIAVGPARAIAFNVSGNDPFGINFKSPNAPITDLIADLEFFLATLLKTQRIPESVLSVNVGANISGVSVLAQQTPVLEDRVERQQVFRAFEQQLLDVTLAVLREHEALHAEATLHVNYPEPTLEQSAAERMQVDDWRLRNGMTTPWALMLRDDPDAYTDLEQARQAWLTNHQGNTHAG